MKINVVGPVKRNFPFGTEIAFMKGFMRLGHDVAGIDPSEQTVPVHTDPDFTLIFKTGHGMNEHLSRLPGPKIVYQPDDLRFVHIQQLMREMRSVCDYALTFDDDGAKEVIKDGYGYKAAQTLLLTADDELYRPLGIPKDLDFVFIGSLGGDRSHASRRRMIQILHGAGFKVSFAESYDMDFIVKSYNRAKVILNHATDVGQQFGSGFGYQCRHFEAGMTRSCLLSNGLIGTTHRLGGWQDFLSEKDLLNQAHLLMQESNRRQVFADDLYQEIRQKHMPEHRAAEVIQFVKNL